MREAMKLILPGAARASRLRTQLGGAPVVALALRRVSCEVSTVSSSVTSTSRSNAATRNSLAHARRENPRNEWFAGRGPADATFCRGTR